MPSKLPRTESWSDGSTATVRRRDTAFTLIELLTVIAIIAVLAALLFPALQGVQGHSRAVKCQQSLRQIGAAFSLYAGDNNMMIPPYRNFSDPARPPWYLPLDTYLHWGTWGDRSAEAGLLCPEYKEPNPANPISSYGMNARYAVDTNRPTILVTQINEPSRAFLVADCNARSYRIDPAYIDPASSGMQIGYHHKGKANLLFLDGHVEARAFADIPKNDERATPEWKAFWEPFKYP